MTQSALGEFLASAVDRETFSLALVLRSNGRSVWQVCIGQAPEDEIAFRAAVAQSDPAAVNMTLAWSPRSVAPGQRNAVAAAANTRKTVSGASCHVKSEPFRLDIRAADLARSI